MNPYYADECVTLYHGDALAVLASLPTASVDAIVTDPPYKLSQEYGATTDPDNLLAVSSILTVAPQMFRTAKPGALCAMFYDTRILPLALHAMNLAGWKYVRALTLYRRWGSASLMSGWMSTSDFVLIFAKPGGKPRFYGNPKHDVYIKEGPEPESFGHPAQKPIAPVRHIISNVCPPDGLLLDPYMGSGTTGAAAVIECRKFIGVEMVEHYAEVAKRRILTELGERTEATEQDVLDFGEPA